MSLGVALRAATAGDRHATLVALLDAWRRVRHPRIAALIELLGDELLVEAPPLPGRTAEQRRTTFDAIASDAIDPVDLGRYLALGWPTKSKASRAHLERLGSWPADPRTARALARFLYESGEPPKNVVRRAEARLAELANDEDAQLDEPDATAIAAIETCFARSRSRVTSARDDEAALLAAIYAEPDNRDLKAVYGDWLSQRNDPRGEFIALQLAPDRTSITSRETALLDEHAVRWAGPIGRWFEPLDRVFEHGFFAGGRLKQGELELLLAAIEGNPAWRLVRTLRSQWNTDTLVVAAVAKLPNIRAVELAVHDGLAGIELLETPNPYLRELGWRLPRYAAALDASSRFGACASLPNLRAMSITTDRTDQIEAWIDEAPVVDRLERLHVTAPEIGQLIHAAVGRETLRELVLVPGRGSWEITLSRERDDDEWPFFTSLVARFRTTPKTQKRWSYELREALSTIPCTSIRTLRVDAPKKKLPPEETAQLGAIIAAFEHATVSVPWQAPTELTPPRLELTLDGPGLLGVPDLRSRLARILEIHPFDTIARDDDLDDAIAIEGDPIDAIVRASEGATRVILGRRGTLLHFVLSRAPYYPRTVAGVLELAGPGPLGAFARFVACGGYLSAALRAPDVPRDAIYAGGFGTRLATIPRGWLVAFANREVLSIVTIEEVLEAIPDTMRALEHDGYLVVETAPSVALATDARTQQLGRSLVGLLERTFAARFYDFRARVTAAVTPLGYTPLEGNESTRAMFRRGERTASFELEAPFDDACVSARTWGDIDESLVDSTPVPTAEVLDRELATIVALLAAMDP